MLVGKHVSLRPASPGEIDLLTEWLNDADYWGRFYNHGPAPQRSIEAEWMGEWAEETRSYLIVKNDTDEPVGTAGFVNPFTIPALWRALEIWYQVHPQARSQGFATQATCLLVNHLFSTRPLERIQATVVVGNDLSCRVLENAGMQRDGVYRNVFFLHGKYVDMHLYSIVRSDWLDEISYRKSRRPF